MNKNLLKLMLFLTYFVTSAQVKIGDNVTVINSSSLLELESKTKGFRLPQMTSTERTAISIPTAGLQVFDTTTNTVWVYNGTAWNNNGATVTASNGLTSASGNVKLGGAISEATTISALTATNKLAITGTGVDAINLDSNTLSLDATNNRVGIGTAAPGFPLEVNGEAKATRLLAYGAGGIISNTAIGSNSLLANTTGGANTAVGNLVLTNNTTGRDNTSVGSNSLQTNTIGENNTVVGASAMALNTTGSNNVAIGTTALVSNSIGNRNTAIGIASGSSITTGSNNLVLGSSTTGITTGSGNVVIGNSVSGLNPTLANNIILADGAGNQRINVDGSGNVGIANTAPAEKLDVTGNVKFSGALIAGSSSGTAGQVLTSQGSGTPTWTTVAGGSSIYSADGTIAANRTVAQTDKTLAFTSTATTGTSHFTVDGTTFNVDANLNRVGIGTAAPGFPLEVNGEARVTRLISRGGGNVLSNVAIGNSSLTTAMTGTENVAMGLSAMSTVGATSSSNTALGSFALNQNSGNSNTALGTRTLYYATAATQSTAVGTTALYNISTGGSNTAIGYSSGSTITTGSNNVILGPSTTGIISGSGNVVIGKNVTDLSAALANNIVLADGEGNQRIRVDGTGNVGIANTAPTEKLDVTGNVKFSGALMPNDTAGTVGQVLTSAGTGAVPTWTTPTTGLSSTLTSANLYVGNGSNVATAVLMSGDATMDNTGALTITAGAGGIYKGSGSLSGVTTVTGGANTLEFTSTATNGFSVDGTTLSVDAANNRIGIGTAAPSDKLNIFGSNSKIVIDNGAGSTSEIGIVFRNGDWSGSIAKSAIISKGTDWWKQADMHFILDSALDNNSYNINTDTKLLIKADTGNIGIGTLTPTSKLQVSGSIATPVNNTTSALTLTAAHSTVTVNLSGALTITLPAASTCSGRVYNIVRTDASSNVLTFSQAISIGNTTFTTSNIPGAIFNIQSDGTSWRLINN